MTRFARNLTEVPLHRPASLKKSISSHVPVPDFPSEHTVRNYLFRIFNKVGTSNRLELALYAIDQREGHHQAN